MTRNDSNPFGSVESGGPAISFLHTNEEPSSFRESLRPRRASSAVLRISIEEESEVTYPLVGVNATDRVLQAPEINPLRSKLKPQIYAGARGSSTAPLGWTGFAVPRTQGGTRARGRPDQEIQRARE